MSAVPGDLRYTPDHEWVRLEADGTAVVGITDHAQQQLGELVFVELPETDRRLSAGDGAAVVESVKAASDVYTPLAGTVVSVNSALESDPALVNRSPFEEGWLFRLKIEGAPPADLLDAAAYRQLIDSSG